MANTTNFTSDRAQYRILLMLVAMSDGPLTREQLQQRVPSSKATLTNYLGHLGARVADWKRGAGNMSPMYDMSEGPDAPKPRAYTRAELAARTWARIRDDDVAHARRNARKRKPNRADKAAAWITRDNT